MSDDTRCCEVEGCDGDHYAKGLCEQHYMRLHRYGRLERERPSQRTRVTPWRYV